MKGTWEDFSHRGTKRSTELRCLKCESTSFGLIVGVKKGMKEYSLTVACIDCGWERSVQRTDHYTFKCAECPEIHTLKEIIESAEAEIESHKGKS